MAPLAFPSGRLMGHEIGEIAILTITSKPHFHQAAGSKK
jgi:hypothetical protein